MGDGAKDTPDEVEFEESQAKPEDDVASPDKPGSYHFKTDDYSTDIRNPYSWDSKFVGKDTNGKNLKCSKVYA